MAKASSKKTTKKIAARPASDAVVHQIDIEELDLDVANPRLGEQVGPRATQTELLDHIVAQFGVEDVLGSIAVNGYFNAEPLVGYRTKNGRYTIAEGNRRLAALLILANDPRAQNQDARHKKYDALRVRHDVDEVRHVPVLVYDDPKEQHLLSYLGVRHISSSQPWDSYAKAAWVDRVMREEGMGLQQIADMIGDQHRTVARIVEGFQFVQQLVRHGEFSPAQSQRAGRGSKSEYPFSWVYTILGYRPVREWLEMKDLGEDREVKLSPTGRARGGKLVQYMFGNKAAGKSAAINDSRQIGLLAKAIADPAGRRMLEKGRPATDYEEITRPASDRLEAFLYSAKDALQECLVLIPEADLDADSAASFADVALGTQKLATAVRSSLAELARGGADAGE